MSELSPQQRIRCMSALVATMAVVSITSSLAWPILSEALRNQGYSESMIGINAAAQFAGIIVVALAAPRIIPAMGFFKTIVLGLVVVAVMLIALPAFRSFETWLLIRFLLGVGNSLLFTAGDTWMNHIVDDRVRGRWMGIYVTVGMAGWALGPLLGAYLDPDTYWPFVWGLLAIMVAAVFLLPTRKLDVKLSLSGLGDRIYCRPHGPTVIGHVWCCRRRDAIFRSSLHHGHPGCTISSNGLCSYLGRCDSGCFFSIPDRLVS